MAALFAWASAVSLGHTVVLVMRSGRVLRGSGGGVMTSGAVGMPRFVRAHRPVVLGALGVTCAVAVTLHVA